MNVKFLYRWRIVVMIVAGSAAFGLLMAVGNVTGLPLPVALSIAVVPGIVTGAVTLAQLRVMEKERIARVAHEEVETARSMNRAFVADLRWAKPTLIPQYLSYRNRQSPYPFTVLLTDGKTGSPHFDAHYRFEFGLRHADDTHYVNEVMGGYYRPLSIFLAPYRIVSRVTGMPVSRVWDNECWLVGDGDGQLAVTDMNPLWNGLLADLEARLYHGRALYP